MSRSPGCWLTAIFICLAGSVSASAVTWQISDQNGHALEHAVVTLHHTDSSTISAISAAAATSPNQLANPFHGKITQIKQAFAPFVSVVPQGAVMAFPNEDSVLHHVYSFSSAKVFQLKLYKGDAHAPVVFDKVGIVELGCNIHDRMRGYIFVTDAVHYGVSDANGQVQIAAGDDQFVVNIWHPRQLGSVASTQYTPSMDRSEELAVQIDVSPPPAAVKRGLKAWVAE
ncbi:MAG: methylamine utilization protein [Pseudomonadaceae bacterium]|nr:methylamine utilization protein [Pseudomonadaceae bacterium]